MDNNTEAKTPNEPMTRFIGGVAHDLNNILGSLLVQVDLLLQRSHDKEPIFVELARVQKNLEKGCLLSQQLLAFGKQQTIQTKVYRLNELVLSLKDILKILAQESVNLQCITQAEVDYFEAIPGQLEQILLNLISNAKDALPQGGNITISTCNAFVDELTSKKLKIKAGPYIILAIADDGMGMDQNTQQHVFKPFFTTKAKSACRGLGLTIVQQTIHQLNGHIELESQIDKGTIFRLYIPVANKDTTSCQ